MRSISDGTTVSWQYFCMYTVSINDGTTVSWHYFCMYTVSISDGTTVSWQYFCMYTERGQDYIFAVFLGGIQQSSGNERMWYGNIVTIDLIS